MIVDGVFLKYTLCFDQTTFNRHLLFNLIILSYPINILFTMHTTEYTKVNRKPLIQKVSSSMGIDSHGYLMGVSKVYPK